MSGDVLNNTDLARKFVGMGGSEILAASKSIRDAEPCAKVYERFRETGCKAQTEEEKQCLAGIGLESRLCTGTYKLTELKNGFIEHQENIPVQYVASILQSLCLKSTRFLRCYAMLQCSQQCRSQLSWPTVNSGL